MSARDVIVNNLTFYGDMTPADLERQTDYILSALDKAGYAVVPKEPTQAMLHAGEVGYSSTRHPESFQHLLGEAYKEMLTAAKETP